MRIARWLGLTLGFAVVALGLPGTSGAEDAKQPSVAHQTRSIDFGPLHVGAIAECEASVTFQDVDDPGLAVSIKPPEGVTVKTSRIFRRGGSQAGHLTIVFGMSMDTGAAGKRSGDVVVTLRGVEARIPIAAEVLPQEAGSTKVLLISTGFGAASGEPSYYRPWFDLVREAKLDVSYMESLSLGELASESAPGPGAISGVPAALARQDVIVVDEGGLVFLQNNSIHTLMQFADSGRRPIVVASPASGGSVLHANLMVRGLGMEMIDRDVFEKTNPGIHPIKAATLEADPLLDGVQRLSFFRPAPIRVAVPALAKILAHLPDSPDGAAAVDRRGNGEIVAIGTCLLPSWIGEFGEGTDNLRFLRNLLTMKTTPE
jgi:hypothetical protein